MFSCLINRTRLRGGWLGLYVMVNIANYGDGLSPIVKFDIHLWSKGWKNLNYCPACDILVENYDIWGC